jgi:hypothetical protein
LILRPGPGLLDESLVSLGATGDIVKVFDTVRDRYKYAGYWFDDSEALKYFYEAYAIVYEFLEVHQAAVEAVAAAFEKADVGEDDIAAILADVPRLLFRDDSAAGLPAGTMYVQLDAEWAPRFEGGPDPGPHPFDPNKYPPPPRPAGGT